MYLKKELTQNIEVRQQGYKEKGDRNGRRQGSDKEM
jgi:hypothetical protein